MDKDRYAPPLVSASSLWEDWEAVPHRKYLQAYLVLCLQ